jgi:hypothetical protein
MFKCLCERSAAIHEFWIASQSLAMTVSYENAILARVIGMSQEIFVVLRFNFFFVLCRQGHSVANPDLRIAVGQRPS